jgi:Xaa-Pro aminopeptidase
LIWKTEKEVRKMIICMIIKNWWDWESFPSIVAFWKNSAIPHHEAWNSIVWNWPLLVDMWTIYQWYLSDFTRTFWIWEKNEHFDEFNKVLKIVKNAHILWKNSIEEWINWKEIDKIVRDFIKSFWYGKYFTHSTWHWIWLQNHEEPRISERRWDLKLKKWMVFTIEPWIYLPGKFWIRRENIVIIR